MQVNSFTSPIYNFPFLLPQENFPSFTNTMFVNKVKPKQFTPFPKTMKTEGLCSKRVLVVARVEKCTLMWDLFLAFLVPFTYENIFCIYEGLYLLLLDSLRKEGCNFILFLVLCIWKVNQWLFKLLNIVWIIC